MEKSIRKIFYTFTYGILALFCFVMTLTGVCQTNYGKSVIQSYLVSTFEKQGISISFNKLSGIIPFEWRIDNLYVKTPKVELEIEKVKFRPLYFRFFKNEIAFEKLDLNGVKASFLDDDSKDNPITLLEDLPYGLHVKSFSLKNISTSLTQNKKFDVKGNIFVAKDLNTYRLKLYIDEKKDHLAINIKAKKLTPARIDIRGKLKTLAPYVDLKNVSFHLRATGDKKDFLNSLVASKRPPIRGMISGKATPYIEEKLFKSTFSTNFQIDENISLSQIFIKAPFFTVRAKATLTTLLDINQCSYSLKTADISNLIPDLFGKAKIDGTLTYIQEIGKCDFTCFSKGLTFDKYMMSNVSFKAKNTFTNKELKASILGNTDFLSNGWNFSGDITWPYEKQVLLQNALIASNLATIKANLNISDFILGEVSGNFSHMAFIEKELPLLRPDGNVSFKTAFTKAEEKQNMDIHGVLSNVYYDKTHSETISIDFSAQDLFSHPKYSLDLDANHASLNNLHLDSVKFTTDFFNANWPYTISAKGKLKDPFEIDSNGFWRYGQQELIINIQDLTGILFTHPFVSPEPIQFQWQDDKIKLSEVKINLSDSSLYALIDMNKQHGSIDLKIDHFPLEFISLFKPEVELNGYFSLNSSLSNVSENLTGKVYFDIHEINSIYEELVPQGSFIADLKKDRMLIKGDLNANGTQLLDINASIPIQIAPLELNFSIDKHKSIDALFSYNGKIEKLLDFFDLGSHFIAGDLNADLHIKNSLLNLDINGKAKISNGIYENYYTGSSLSNITADIIANNQMITLKSLHATGKEKGEFSSKGKLSLSYHKDYPFEASIDFEDLLLAQFIYGDAKGRGKLKLTGNKNKADLAGRIKINEANIDIPSSLPTDVPDLQVRYIHPLPILDLETKIYQTNFPCYLDLLIDAPENVSIEGKGVISTWGGSFSIVGKIDEVIPKGQLELKTGEFSFAGKVFKLTEGTLMFPGTKDQPPFLELSGQLTEKGKTIIGSLKGPINKPKLDFHSIPPLPMSQILSLLLFGQDLEEISGIQAVQLAALVASLSGDGPDILESTRKSLGIDRLNIVSVPVKDKEEALSVQVGKYITKGVMVTVTQGAGPDQREVGVEVDLSKGFSFQAETQQQLEQGKFTLKWNYSY